MKLNSRYEESFRTYRDIIKNSHDDYEDERMANLSAVVASIVATQQYSVRFMCNQISFGLL